MAMVVPLHPGPDDPLRLREMLGRATSLATQHRVRSVVVGMAGREGDLLFPEVVDYLASALRMDDSVLRLTRERVVLMLTDVDRAAAESIVQRLLAEFRERFATITGPEVAFGYFEVAPGTGHLTVKQVLPRVFRGNGAGEPEADEGSGADDDSGAD
jgi:hypothetical protein